MLARKHLKFPKAAKGRVEHSESSTILFIFQTPLRFMVQVYKCLPSRNARYNNKPIVRDYFHKAIRLISSYSMNETILLIAKIMIYN